MRSPIRWNTNRNNHHHVVQLLFFLTIVLHSLENASCGPQRSVQVINNSGSKIDIYWVHPETRNISPMGNDPLIPGADTYLNSFGGHEFEIHELPSEKTGVCKTIDETCRRALFTVSEGDDQLVTITPTFEADFTDNKVIAQKEAGDLIEECQSQFNLDLSVASSEEVSKAMGSLVNCVQGQIATTLERFNEEINFQATVRKDMARKLENYTCEDDTLDSSEPISQEEWYNPNEDMVRLVNIMHKRPSSQIHVVENFLVPEECQAMEEAAQAKLHRATVADGKGGSRFSDSRKAMQAGIKVDWSKEAEGDPIARLSRRIYDYTNHVLGLGIEEHGQEDLMSIQYFGRGLNDTAPDRYTPHCDGDCQGLPHKHGTRMATMVMYCAIPERGGHTNFPNSGVHVKPQPGNAVFFSYIDPMKKVMDTGFTEHSGCPVFVGEKKIVTQWIRYGVDAENPWDSFNTLGVKKTEDDNE